MKKIKVFEAFTGYAGASFGLHNSGLDYEVIGFSEIDKYAIKLLKLNFPTIHNYGDITQIDPTKLPDFDLFTGGFPCQPFSSIGLQDGELDKYGRGTLFYDIIRILQVKKPSYILLENVKGLTAAKFKPTFDKIIAALQSIGYDVRYQILNSKDYGIPQNRERLWIFGYLGKLPDTFTLAPATIPLTTKFKDVLESNPPSNYYKTPAQMKLIYKRMRNQSLAVSEPSCLDLYNQHIHTDGLCMTILEPHSNMYVLEPNDKVRKLTIKEIYRLMGFTDGQMKFGNLSYTQLETRAGNGWDVHLTGLLFKHIFSQL